nr:unnamed protein product [Digitaria exilis]
MPTAQTCRALHPPPLLYIGSSSRSCSNTNSKQPHRSAGHRLLSDASQAGILFEMGSVGVEEDAGGKVAVEAFLERCAPSGDAAYAELRALLARLHDPTTRRAARVFLADLRRRQSSSSSEDAAGGDFFQRFGFRIQELLLHHNPADAFLSMSSPGNC